MLIRCTLLGLLLCFLAGIASANTRTLDLRPVYDGPTDRTYFYAVGASEADMVDLRRDLVAYGASKIMFFIPDVIVCELPAVVDPYDVIKKARVSFTTDMRPAATSSRGPREVFGLDWVRELYADYDRQRPEIEQSRVVAADVSDAIAPQLPWAPLQRSSAIEDRGAIYNTDLMIGDILAQLVFPESEPDIANTEEWTPEELSAAASAASLAFLYYQDKYDRTPLNFSVRKLESVATPFEPIKVTDGDRGDWINSVMSELGHEDPGGDHILSVTAFNNAARQQFGTDWVFTAFIVDASGDANKRFKGMSANSIPTVGGPYFAIPYPVANLRGDGIGNFSQHFKHDVGHIFWAVDEHPGGFTDCSTRSGYMRVFNSNKQTGTTPLGARQGCFGTPDLCIMHIQDAMNNFQGDPCLYTALMHGSGDENTNGVPDALDDFPILEFETTGTDTVLERTFPLRFKAISEGVRNRNPMQPVDTRTNYAVPVRMVARSENNIPAQVLEPLDGEYDEREEEFEFEVTALPSGLSVLTFVTRNMVARTSSDIRKRIFYVGLTYLQFSVEPTSQGSEVGWVMFGELFDAELKLHRITEDGVDEVLVDNIQPIGSIEPFTTFKYEDTDIEETKKYTYWVEGTFDLMYKGQMQTFESDSDAFETVATLPFQENRLLSVSAPNPFSKETFTTVFVPDRGGSLQGETQDGLSQSRVEINIYDVAGRRVKQIIDEVLVTQSFTIVWDGTNDLGDPAATGIYFMKAKIAQYETINKIVLVR